MKSKLLNIFKFSLMAILAIAKPIIANDPVTVPKIELNRYIGSWYEIARLPNFFQNKCTRNTTATYKLLDSGLIEVCNSCTAVDGKIIQAKGVARVDDKKQNSKLSVSFFEILGVRPVWGDYWILGIADDYRFSVVGDRSRKYAWILSRTPQLSAADLSTAIGILKSNGFNTQLLITTPQADGVPRSK